MTTAVWFEGKLKCAHKPIFRIEEWHNLEVNKNSTFSFKIIRKASFSLKKPFSFLWKLLSNSDSKISSQLPSPQMSDFMTSTSTLEVILQSTVYTELQFSVSTLLSLRAPQGSDTSIVNLLNWCNGPKQL